MAYKYILTILHSCQPMALTLWCEYDNNENQQITDIALAPMQASYHSKYYKNYKYSRGTITLRNSF